MKYAILSDIHGNLEAFTTVLQKCKELEVDQYICLGDIVGYNANPKECLDIIRTLPLAGVVKGNHDEYASNNDEVMEGFNPHARTAVLWTKAQLTYEDRAWLSSLPMRLTVKGTSITAVHATLDSGCVGLYFRRSPCGGQFCLSVHAGLFLRSFPRPGRILQETHHTSLRAADR